MLPGAALGSLHVRSRCPSAFHTRHTLGSLAARFCWRAALQALDGARARFGAPPLDAARRSTWEPRGSFLLAGAALQALDGTRARTDRPTDDRPTDRPPPTDRPTTDRPTDRPPPRSELLLAPPLSFFYTHTRHTHVDSLTRTRQTHIRSRCPSLTVPERALLLAGAALQALDGARARFGPPPLMLPGAALGSLAARFCWQGCCQAQHLKASRLVSAGRGSTSGSGRYPSAFRGPLDAARRSTWDTVSFFYTHTRHTHVDSLTHTRQTHTRSLTVPFAALQALDGTRARFGAPPLMLPGAALGSLHIRSRCPSAFHTRHTLGSLAARFCWQGQHFRLWTVPERVSGPPPLMLPGAALGSLAARFCWQGQHFRLWTVPERVSGPHAARRSTWEPRGSFLLAGAALQALDGTRARFGAPPLMLPGAALGSLAARFCWQGQHFRLWTVPERVSGPPPLMLPGAALVTRCPSSTYTHTRHTHVDSLTHTSRCPSQHFRLWTVPERVSGPPP